uniref:Protein translocase subunit SecA n=1 Tax=Karenia brevis TaxID=156230 RepID=A0A0S2QD88_KARBR|nr:thylakoid membrane localized Sec system component [Karenia brevis]
MKNNGLLDFYQQILENFDLAKYKRQVTRINVLEPVFSKYSNQDLRDKTVQLKTLLMSETRATSNVVEEAFALVREASKRVLGLRHFDVQIIGGLVINDDKIAEMKTGEGKTLASILPAFLNALYGKGVHIITVNEYLAQRDSQYTGQLHNFLGLSVGLVTETMSSVEKKKNYYCDITYVTNSELGFDYLRDNLVQNAEGVVQRSLFYCVIDEIDSVLIDDASTPLIIAGSPTSLDDGLTEKYIKSTRVANILKRDKHYKTEEKTKSVLFSDAGISMCETCLGIERSEMYSLPDPFWFIILNAIKAKEFYRRNRNYIIDANLEIVILDEFTGRALEGRRWSEGMQQAMESKERLTISGLTPPQASISYQNLFLLYERLSGMSGTAATEKQEFSTIYDLPVVVIPTNKPGRRIDFSDSVYTKQLYKWQGVINECRDMYRVGRPVLIGTKTITASERVADFLKSQNIPYQLLNARPENSRRESEIIAQAGCESTVTIATNMAGRGTDIILGGNSQYFASTTIATFVENINFSNASMNSALRNYHQEYVRSLQSSNEKKLDLNLRRLRKFYNLVLYKKSLLTQKNRKTVLRLGGLHVIGTERHESRRIDNQLRGRAGRQGEPGSSRFFTSLDDDLLRQFGSEALQNFYSRLGVPEDIPLQSNTLTTQLDQAQQKVENSFFDARKRLFDYDQVLNSQRNCVYSERTRQVQSPDLPNLVRTSLKLTIDDLFKCTLLSKFFTSKSGNGISNLSKQEIREIFYEILEIPLMPYPFSDNSMTEQISKVSIELKSLSNTSLFLAYANSSRPIPLFVNKIASNVTLRELDTVWSNHLQRMSALKELTQWSAYGRRNPLTEYKRLSFYYFLQMINIFQQKVLQAVPVLFESIV